MKLYETITAENWTKEAFAKDAGGRQVGAKRPSAQRWCLAGHLRRIGAKKKTRARVNLAIKTLFPERAVESPVWSIYNFNDSPKTVLDDVLRVCKLADV